MTHKIKEIEERLVRLIDHYKNTNKCCRYSISQWERALNNCEEDEQRLNYWKNEISQGKDEIKIHEEFIKELSLLMNSVLH